MKKINDILILDHIKTSVDYPNKLFDFLFKIESKHFWFIGRNKIILSSVKNVLHKKNNKANFLEIGCGTCYVLSYIEKKLNLDVSGIDINKNALTLGRKRTKAKLICTDLYKNHFKDKFDFIGLFDVIEHIEDQSKFLAQCGKLLKKKGVIFITVPADNKLWSNIDTISGHKRRYSKKDLINILNDNNYKIININYYGFFYYFPQLIIRKFGFKIKNTKLNEYSLLKQSLKVPIAPLNYSLKLLLYLESILINKVSLPFGSSIIVSAEKIK